MHAVVTADTIGGVWIYARELVTGLIRRGLQVTLVSFGEIPAPEQTAWMDALPGLDFRPTAFRLEWMQEAEEDMQASCEYLQAVVREVQPDILHLNQYCYGALQVDVPKVVVAHSDVVSWWVAVHGEEPRDGKWLRWYRNSITAGLSHADVVVAPSRWMLEAIHTYYTAPQQSQVIYNGRNPGLFNAHMTKEDLLLSVGRLWDGGKQVALLAERDHPLPVYVAGSEEHPEAVFRGRAQAGHGQRRVHFRGVQTEAQLRQLYSRAAMYAATSRYEPFGLAPLEAALSRCALIANDIPTFHELWGDTAYYFRYNDADSLARAIVRLHEDRELRQTYANLAYHRARECFTAERMADEYLALYRRLVAARSRDATGAGGDSAGAIAA
jgi:glycosyltransferase involved in cell wall biosynthesis